MEVSTEIEPDVEQALRLLTAVFAPTDTVLLRPIETWVEQGRKQSRVARNQVRYVPARRDLLQGAIEQQLAQADAEGLNLFFGVCPRLGSGGQYDQAWQIRKVPALWADVDHSTIDEVLERVAIVKLPEPSLVVNSGHGAHLYWLLETPWQINDAKPPPPVEIEWQETPTGRRPLRYVVVDGQRHDLSSRPSITILSPQAVQLQQVLAGIARAIGGDHTQDLSRLLRLPGTLNRKNQRNGEAPVPCELVRCDSEVRYPFHVFESLAIGTATRSPSTVRRPPKNPASHPSTDRKLAQLIEASAAAPVGQRSEADFRLCCYAIRRGLAPESVWPQVSHLGKFQEAGRTYFERTWTKAEQEVRQGGGRNGRPPTETMALPAPEDRATIVVDPRHTPVARTLASVTEVLLASNTCFLRAEQLVEVHASHIRPILTADELAGLLNAHAEVVYVNPTGIREFRPLARQHGSTWLNKPTEVAQLPKLQLFTRAPVYTHDWRLVTPGYDPHSQIYYAGSPIAPRSTTAHLDRLLSDFCFKTPGDRSNYLGLLLTNLLVPHFIGSKPAALFNGNQPGLGKSVLAQILAILRDGSSADTVTYNPNDEEFEKRLGAVVRGGASTVIIDNAKLRGRQARIDSPCLERCITDPILSFRLLGQSASIRMENSHTFCITANSTDVSRDLITRCTVVNLFHEGDPTRRRFSMTDPEAYAQAHRTEIIGELLGMVQRWLASGQPLAAVETRFNKRDWGRIVGGILEACDEPDFLLNASEMATELDETRREFTELVQLLADEPQQEWSAGELAEFCAKHKLLESELGDGNARSQTTRFGKLASPNVAERFPLADGREAVFRRYEGRKGKLYGVGILESAER